MFISFKTDGSDGAVDTVNAFLVGYSDTEYNTFAAANGRSNFRYEVVGADLVITEEWDITRAEYDALDITPCTAPQYNGAVLPLVETDDHLTF